MGCREDLGMQGLNTGRKVELQQTLPPQGDTDSFWVMVVRGGQQVMDLS